VPLPLAASRQVTCSYCGSVAELSAEEALLHREWLAGINSAVDTDRARVQALRQEIQVARQLDVQLFLRQGPQTIEPAEEPVAAVPEVDEDDPDASDAAEVASRMRQLHEEHSQRVDNLTRQLVAPGISDTERSRITCELTEAATTLQQKITRLIWGRLRRRSCREHECSPGAGAPRVLVDAAAGRCGMTQPLGFPDSCWVCETPFRSCSMYHLERWLRAKAQDVRA
jgi:hypothetical protein